MPVLRKTINLTVNGNTLVATDSVTGLATTDAGVQGEDGAVSFHVAVPSDWQDITTKLQIISQSGGYDESGAAVGGTIDMLLRQGVTLSPGRITVRLAGTTTSGVRKTADCKTLMIAASDILPDLINHNYPYPIHKLTGSGGALVTQTSNDEWNVNVSGTGGDMLQANYANGSGIANANKVDHAIAADNAANADNAVTAATQSSSDSSTKIATTAFVQGKLSDIIALAGWTPSTATFAYTSADSPIFVMASSVDVTANFYPGVRVKLTQDSAIKYFIVHAASGTSITLYGGTDYTLTSSPITDVSFSAQKCPAGFPLNPAKWTVQVVDSNDHQGYANAVGTWYNALSIIVPIGAWRLSYSCIAAPSRNSGTASQITTLSTTNNGETDSKFTTRLSVSPVTDIDAPVKAEDVVDVATKTTYYLNVKTLDSGTNLRILASTFGQPTVLSAVDAYL